MDFPWLYKSRPSWDVLLVSLLLGGTALCVTSLLLSWTLLRRKVVSIGSLKRITWKDVRFYEGPD